ncbi:Periplasmic copper-binding protein [Novymonas esmeraldas]|uniref:Periplasmic copper-binding protein n=1 Tax=Novymonas esmeraldas TaxID=1808958 RepID=A0AAW0F4Y6_9TRYP
MAPQTIVVGTQTGAHAATLAAALEHAAPGDTITVSAGVYEETVHLSFNVTVVAAPAAEGAEDPEAARATVMGAVVISANVTLEGVEVRGMVDVRKAHAVLDRCDIHHGPDGVRVHAGATVTIRSSRVHHCTAGGDGVYFMAGSSGEVSQTDIFECRVNALHIQGSDAVLRENRIHDCAFGVYYERSATGLCEQNTIEHVHKFGLYVTDGSDPVMRGNTVRSCGVLCLYASKGGRGTCSGNTFEGSLHTLADAVVQLSDNQVSGTSDVEATPMVVGA